MMPSWSLDLGKLSFWKRLRFAWNILRGQEATIVFDEDEVADGEGELSAGGWRRVD